MNKSAISVSIYRVADKGSKAVSSSSSSSSGVLQNPLPPSIKLQQLLVSEKNHDDNVLSGSRIPTQTECDFSSVNRTLPSSLTNISTCQIEWVDNLKKYISFTKLDIPVYQILT